MARCSHGNSLVLASVLMPTRSSSTITPLTFQTFAELQRTRWNLCLYHSWFDSFGQILVQTVDVFSFDRYLGSVLKLHLTRQMNVLGHHSVSRNNADCWQEVYQVHRDDMWRHKFGTVYQPVCPSNLNGVTFGGSSEPDAVSVLKVFKKNLVYQLELQKCGSLIITRPTSMSSGNRLSL